MPTESRINKMRMVAARRQRGVVMVIEDVHDPHNAAAILRSCDAFGVQRVCFIFDKQKRYNPRRIGKLSSSSANKWLDFDVYSSAAECLQALKSEGFQIVSTALSDGAVDLYEADFAKGKVALVVGNEHDGVSKECLEMSDKVVMIPMTGMVQSLNVSVGAAISLAEVVRQRAVLGKERFIEKIAQEELVDRWISKS